MGKKIKTDKSSLQVTLKQERVRAYVCARGVHKGGQERGNRKGEHADTLRSAVWARAQC